MMEHGMHTAWTSPALPHLTSEKSEFPVTEAQGGWIASLFSLGTIFGIMLCPFFMDRIGRKYTMLLFFSPRLFSWILIIYANSYITLYVARIVAGVGCGGLYIVTAVYIGEISEKKIRGTFLTILNISTNVGILIVAITAAYLDYRTMNLVMLAVPISYMILFLFTPETPYFYLMQNQQVSAIRTLMKLKGETNSEMVMTDIDRMNKAIELGRKSTKNTAHQLFSNRGCRKAMIILLFSKAAHFYSGFLAILSYTQNIMSNSGSSLDPTHAAMILGAVDIIAGLPASQLIDRTGRRVMFLVSGVLSSLALGSLGMFFFFKIHLKIDVSSFTWLPLASLIFFKLVSNIGLAIIPTIFMAELFPIKLKGFALAITNVFTGLYAFTSKLAFQYLSSAAGIYTTFWTFGLVCMIGVIIVFFIAPETTGKSLEEIQYLLNPKKNRKCVSLVEKTELDRVLQQII